MADFESGWVTNPNQLEYIRKQNLERKKKEFEDEMSIMPQLPGFESLINKDTGLLGPQYQLTPEKLGGQLDAKMSGINLDKRGLEAFRQRALGTGPSAWAGMMNRQMGLQEQTARDQAMANAAQSQAGARSQLAMRGGLGAGSRERLARGGALGTLQAQQDISRQGLMNRANLGIKDEEMRMKALQQLPGMEVQALQPELEKTKIWSNMAQFDTGNALKSQQFNMEQALKELQAKRDADMLAAQENRKAYSAFQQSKAEKEAAGGCWICTEVNKTHPLSEIQKKSLFKFKKFVLKNHREPARFYLKDCAQLVNKMNRANVNWPEWVGFDEAIVTLIQADMLRAAYVLYRNTVLRLVARYWPDCESVGYKAAIKEFNDQTEAFTDDIPPPPMAPEDEHLLERLL